MLIPFKLVKVRVVNKIRQELYQYLDDTLDFIVWKNALKVQIYIALERPDIQYLN